MVYLLQTSALPPFRNHLELILFKLMLICNAARIIILIAMTTQACFETIDFHNGGFSNAASILLKYL